MKKQICKNCGFYQVLYIRTFFRFLHTDVGFCGNCQNAVSKKDGCEFYCVPCEEKTTTVQMLDFAIDDVKALQRIYNTISSKT